MPEIALNNLTSFAASTVGSQSAASSGNCREFDDHLQRARRDGFADDQPTWTSRDPISPDAASAPGRDFDRPPAQNDPRDEKSSQPSSACHTSANTIDDRASAKGKPAVNDRDKDSQNDADGSMTSSGMSSTSRATAANVSVVAQASTAAPTAACVDPPAVAAVNVKVATVGAPGHVSAGTIPAISSGDRQSIETTNAPDNAASQAADGAATATDLQSRAAEVTQSMNSSVTTQQMQPTVVADPAVQVTQAVATASFPAAIKLPNLSAPTPSKQSSSSSAATAAPADQPKSARSTRATGTDQRSVSIPSATELQVAATDTAAMGNEAESQPADSSPTASQKNNAAPAVEGVAAKTPPANAGLNATNAAPALKQVTTSAPTAQSATSSGGSEVDRIRFLQRVAGAFQAADDQGGQIRIRLSPPELGSMRLEISVRSGVMTAHVQTETETARNMLLDHLPQLRDRLADHNIKIDHFDVELMNHSGSGTPQNFAGNAYQRQAVPSGNAARPRATSGAIEPTRAPVGIGRPTNGRLDVTV